MDFAFTFKESTTARQHFLHWQLEQRASGVVGSMSKANCIVCELKFALVQQNLVDMLQKRRTV